MSQIDELQSRITAALDRISQGLEAQGSAGADTTELDALRTELEDERATSAQLEERHRRLKDKLEVAEEAAAKAVEESRAMLEKLDGELQSLRRANAQLRENNQALREAQEAGVAEPHLINKAMLAELEGLRAARNADRAETDAVLAELTRLINTAGEDSSEKEGA